MKTYYFQLFQLICLESGLQICYRRNRHKYSIFRIFSVLDGGNEWHVYEITMLSVCLPFQQIDRVLENSV
jgi:hypothetical protein